MPRIEWDDSFSINMPEIDGQHKKLLDIINELHDSLLTNGNRESSSVTKNALQSLKDYAWNHFRFEEEYMRKIKYPDLENHAELHLNFYMQILEYIKEEKKGKPALTSEIMQSAMSWLRTHLLSEDQKFAGFAAKALIEKAESCSS